MTWADPWGLISLNRVQQQIDDILREHLPAIQAIDPNAEIGYRGSAASGISKAHDPVYTNRRRDASEIKGMKEIEASIDRKLRLIFPWLKKESFGFRIFKTHELMEFARKGDIQRKIGCK
ncbi:hypothetical protein A9G28_07710 [Gilliamella sp. Fer1-1]|uniref:hypothetical protein n=1 Tax=unclassified Gilliamella TaxID=2685620 RepID=UPI00080EB467|nr:hypothetical protein A9G47_08055 [Gilliamella apicola]OCG27720.1 hypothetical protein A9G45_08255 [Gilliamella apicola]OCG29840.1 hypothetical protein A9G46_12700 [Gilliamella apicola]OCG37597.1 hypothetical protein A9G29_11340 [Gilliamella apicola]OCG40655.1 hypothetical protein A9G28_07710 [Gilliamella apicola]